MNTKLIALVNPKTFKMIIPFFAAQSSDRTLMTNVYNALTASVGDITTISEEQIDAAIDAFDKGVLLEESGTVADVYQFLAFFKEMGFTGLSTLPITQIPQTMVSPFTSAATANNIDYLSLQLVPEIRSNPELINKLEEELLQKMADHKREIGVDHKIDMFFHRELRDKYLALASRDFYEKASEDRKEQFAYFLEQNPDIEDHAAYFLAESYFHSKGEDIDPNKWPAEYRDFNSETMKNLVASNKDKYDEYIFSQFIMDEQLRLLEILRKSFDLQPTEVNIAVGTHGADAIKGEGKYFNPERNIGCPGQDWGVNAYMFNEMKDFFSDKKIAFLARYGFSPFFDAEWEIGNQYSIDKNNPSQQNFDIPLWDREKMIKMVKIFMRQMFRIIPSAGGETLGPYEIQMAVEEAHRQLVQDGYDMRTMYVTQHKNDGNTYPNPYEAIQSHADIYLGTHDTPTTFENLLSRRGDGSNIGDFNDHYKVASYLSRVFGVMVTLDEIPLDPSSLTRDLGMHMIKRLRSFPANTASLTFQDIVMFLFPEKNINSSALTFNIAGTSVEVNNENFNFQKGLPDLKEIMQDESAKSALKEAVSGSINGYDYEVVYPRLDGGKYHGFIAEIKGDRPVVYKNKETGKYEAYKHSMPNKPVIELKIANAGKEHAQGGAALGQLSGKVDSGKKYILVDINTGNKWEQTGLALQQGFFVSLPPRSNHHFVIYEK